MTFPSDARSGKVDLLVYLDVCRLCNSVTPIRGREDYDTISALAAALNQRTLELGLPLKGMGTCRRKLVNSLHFK